MQANAEELTDHVEQCNVTFKKQVMEKVVCLKKGDTILLTERVEELKGQEGTELQKRNAVYVEKKQIARQMEIQVSGHS